MEDNKQLSLTENQRKYLTAIFLLFRVKDSVRMIDVANLLQVSTGSVSSVMKLLREKGIIETTSKGEITLIISEAYALKNDLLLPALPLRKE